MTVANLSPAAATTLVGVLGGCGGIDITMSPAEVADANDSPVISSLLILSTATPMRESWGTDRLSSLRSTSATNSLAASSPENSSDTQ